MNSAKNKKPMSRPTSGPTDKGKPPAKHVALPLTDKEKILTDELEALTKEFENAKTRVQKLRQDGKWLSEESERVKTENQEYQAYIEKKTKKREDAVISLTDLHTQQIKSIEVDRLKIQEEFEIKKQGLMDVLMQKQQDLTNIQNEILEMQNIKEIMTEQDAEIKRLQEEISQASRHHAQAVQKLKSDYVAERTQVEAESKAKISDMSREADEKAESSLQQQSLKIRQENREMRQQLMQLIEKNEMLFSEKRRLEKQKQQLLVETRHSADLAQLNPDLKYRLTQT